MMYAATCKKRNWWIMTNAQLHADNRRRAADALRTLELYRQASRRR